MQVYFDEQKVLEDCLKNDRKAQELLYKQFSKKMYGVCLRYASDTDTAADILQEGFIKMFKALPKYSSTGSFEGWLRRIIVNTALDYYRKSSKLIAVSDYDTEINDENTVDALSKISAEEIIGLVRELPIGYRTVFNLYVIEGYSHKEISSQLDISEGTSKSQLSRAKAILKNKIERTQNLELHGISIR